MTVERKSRRQAVDGCVTTSLMPSICLSGGRPKPQNGEQAGRHSGSYDARINALVTPERKPKRELDPIPGLARQNAYRVRLSEHGRREALFQIPNDMIQALDELKNARGLRNRSEAVIAVFTEWRKFKTVKPKQQKARLAGRPFQAR